MDNKAIEILTNVRETTLELIEVIGEENDAIVNKDTASFKRILSRKYDLMRKYDGLSLELSSIVEEIRTENKAELDELIKLTEKLTAICDINTKLLSREQDIALNIMSVMKEVADESSGDADSGFVSVKA